jgi:DNA-binding protein YbaB
MPEYNETEMRRRLSGMLDNLSRLRDAQAQLAELQAQGEAADGLVGVTVGPTGALINVRIDPRAMRLDSQTLAESIVEAARNATAQASEKSSELFAGMTSGLDVGSLMTSGTASTPTSDDPMATVERLRGILS